MRRLNRLQVPDLGFSSFRPNSSSLLGRLAESVAYTSTRIPLGLAESLHGLAESPLKIEVFFLFLTFQTLGCYNSPPLKLNFVLEVCYDQLSCELPPTLYLEN